MKSPTLIDTNLLLLLAVGTYDVRYIQEHKRTDSFTAEDYEILLMLLSDSELVLTANILTEASNLLWSGEGDRKKEIRKVLKAIADNCSELHVESRAVMSCPEFMPLGLTDAGILELRDRAGLILTQDLDLHLAALERGLQSDNFTHYRSLI
ncbi:hypothetical protein [Pseudomonas sp. T8]|uniref:hypothetical protein n=1 Tax=Pseudomonas sp. T8 TaxID=645292 RepID=UPI00214905D0|nr:hypothetical protein [Pseudomonas sp. T8]UUT22102.1 hypothetical protein NRG23_31180 [Pseudomonas sp. T8]